MAHLHGTGQQQAGAHGTSQHHGGEYESPWRVRAVRVVSLVVTATSLIPPPAAVARTRRSAMTLQQSGVMVTERVGGRCAAAVDRSSSHETVPVHGSPRSAGGRD